MFKRIAVGISGGVDSAVAALLLKRKGFDVTGVFMKNWDLTNETGRCQSQEDEEHAEWICKKLKIPFVQANFVKDYWINVFSYLIEQYENGYTPNPDIMCNKYIKFDKFFKFARDNLQADAIATGHYAKNSFGPYLEYFKPNTNVHLLKADDEGKDQTFFLCQTPQETLRYSMFPLGSYLKSEVKRIAQEAELDVVAYKKESMGICFIGKRNFQEFISEYIPDKPGKFVDLENGHVVGQHMGFHHWTIGQGIKLGGFSDAYYVHKKVFETNDIIVVKGTSHPALYSDLVISDNPTWISTEPSEFSTFSRMLNCDFRSQHREQLIPCVVHKNLRNQLLVQLSQPVRALTEGQFLVLYNGAECLGSSVISFRGPSYCFLNEEAKIISHKNSSLRNRK